MFGSCYMVTKIIMVTNPLTAKLMLLPRVTVLKYASFVNTRFPYYWTMAVHPK